MRNRISELRQVRAGDLEPHPSNWRGHPEPQQAALRGILDEVGWAAALVAYESNGGLRLIDGHLRAGIDPDEEVPVLVLDVDDEEAEKLLVSLDPISAMARADGDKLRALLDSVEVSDAGLAGMLRELSLQASPAEVEDQPKPTPPTGNSTLRDTGVPFKGDCGKCGAKRIDRQLGLESTPEEHVARIVEVFAEVKRVLRDDGTVWLNYGDCYASGSTKTANHRERDDVDVHGWSKGDATAHGSPAVSGIKPKDLVGMPWRVAFALQADGWWLRSDIIWAKRNVMPESVTDRPTNAHEHVFLLAKRGRYFYDADAVRVETEGNWNSAKGFSGVGQRAANTGYDLASQNQFNGLGTHEDREQTGRNLWNVWHLATQPFPEAHFATYPLALVEPCVRAGSAMDSIVLDPFSGSGTTGVVSLREGRRYLGIELNPEYAEMARNRIARFREEQDE
jgi:DNA modification methylase